MSDFGKILDDWESTRRSGSRAARPEVRSETERNAEYLRSWLERHPPVDKDAGQAATAARTERPEALPVDGVIDLHGYRLAEALAATGQFLDSSVRAGHRKVMVVHGKGENGQGVLRREIRAYLERHPATGAMGYARGRDGGRGALWVVLRSGARTASTARGR